MEYKQEIIDILKEIKEKGPFKEDSGICYNLEVGLYEKYCLRVDGVKLVGGISPSWEHFSGLAGFPVDGKYFYYSITGQLWKGEQLELRHSLIEHIIKTLKES